MKRCTEMRFFIKLFGEGLSPSLTLTVFTVHHSLTLSLFEDLDTVKRALVFGLITPGVRSWKKHTLAYCLNLWWEPK